MNQLNYLPQFIGLIMIISGVPAFYITYKASQNLWLSVAVAIVYESFVIISGFTTKIWQRVETKWADRLAEWIDLNIQSFFSRYRQRYLEYMIYQHRVFDIKGLTTQGPYTLELEKVFVQLEVEPIPPDAANANPFKSLPENLRSGGHTIWEYLNSKADLSNKLVILGAPGSGKTTLLKHIIISLVKSERKNKKIGKLNPLPVLLVVRDLALVIKANPAISLMEIIVDNLKTHQMALPPKGWLEKQLTKGYCIIMLDGLDEVADPEVRKQVADWVERCIAAYGQNQFLLTSRPYGYNSNSISGVTVLQVRPFSRGQINEFVNSWYLTNEIMSSQKDDSGVRQTAKQGANDLIRCLREIPTLEELAVNPLLLTMITTVHRYRGWLPTGRADLYQEICEVTLGKRKAATGQQDVLSPGQKIRVLGELAYQMMVLQERDINSDKASKLISSVLEAVIPVISGNDFLRIIENSSGLIVESEIEKYSFSHLSFQEYLAAVHIKENHLEKELIAQKSNSWWHETIRLYCGLVDASAVIASCLENFSASSLDVGLSCVGEAREVNPTVRSLYKEIVGRGTDFIKEHFQSKAKKLLTNRLRAMCSIGEEAWIDTSLISNIEYQLFIDDMRSCYRYIQPDHWKTYQYPNDQALYPVLGVRPLDAAIFCRWLTTEIGNNEWDFRLPSISEVARCPLSIDDQQPVGYWSFTKTIELPEYREFIWANNVKPIITSVEDTLKLYFIHAAYEKASLYFNSNENRQDIDQDSIIELTFYLFFARLLDSVIINDLRHLDTFDFIRDLKRITERIISQHPNLDHFRKYTDKFISIQNPNLIQSLEQFCKRGFTGNYDLNLRIPIDLNSNFMFGETFKSESDFVRDLIKDLDYGLIRNHVRKLDPRNYQSLNHEIDGAIGIMHIFEQWNNICRRDSSPNSLYLEMDLDYLAEFFMYHDNLLTHFERLRDYEKISQYEGRFYGAFEWACENSSIFDMECVVAKHFLENINKLVFRELLNKTVSDSYSERSENCISSIVKAMYYLAGEMCHYRQNYGDQIDILTKYLEQFRIKEIDAAINSALELALIFLPYIEKGDFPQDMPERNTRNCLACIQLAQNFSLSSKRFLGHFPAFEGIRIVKTHRS